jgi:hypothetical protein
MIRRNSPAVLVTGVLVLAGLAGHRLAAAQQPARGYIDARWNSGYVLSSRGHHQRGCFVVCPGCSCLVPTQYRSFADLVFPRPADDRVGAAWYLGQPMATSLPLSVEAMPVESPTPVPAAPMPPSAGVQ